MKQLKGILVFLFVVSLVAALPQQAKSQTIVDDFFKALQGGKFSGSFRLGYEYSDLKQSPKISPAHGFNVQSRLNYRTGEFYKCSGFLQLQNVSNLMEEFNDTKGGAQKDRDPIADPEGSRVHQGYVDLGFLPQTVIRLGRQEINLDDQRLVGSIPWRQNAQSFDAVTITNKSIKDLELFAGFADRVNTIKLTQVDLDAFWMFHATYSGIKGHKLTAFTYLLDAEGDPRDIVTYGLRATGKIAMIKYAVDYAYQTDWNDNDLDVGAQMFNAYLGAIINKMFSAGVGFSYIEGKDDSDDRPFDTLFSTAHAFNGWADDFLKTNGGGLVNGLADYYVDVTVKYMGAKFKAVYHYFDTTDDDVVKDFDDAYGDEIDLLLVKGLYKNVKGLLKYSHYNERNSSGTYANQLGLLGGHDEDVFWARLMVKF